MVIRLWVVRGPRGGIAGVSALKREALRQAGMGTPWYSPRSILAGYRKRGYTVSREQWTDVVEPCCG